MARQEAACSPEKPIAVRMQRSWRDQGQPEKNAKKKTGSHSMWLPVFLIQSAVSWL
jgi:hypothetical protein